MGRKPAGSAWRWSRTAETRRILLRAAREIFAEQGFAGASVADVVARAGSSVGSLYHHFGGKAELFMTLWHDYQAAQEERAAGAVAKARAAGEHDPFTLFISGARAYLAGAWEQREAARLFIDGDGPPGFEVIRRTRAREWVQQNAILLGASASPVDRLTVTVLTTIIGGAEREIVTCATRQEADVLTEAAIRLLRRLDPLPRSVPAGRAPADSTRPPR